jgi:hypothetical protein
MYVQIQKVDSKINSHQTLLGSFQGISSSIVCRIDVDQTLTNTFK